MADKDPQVIVLDRGEEKSWYQNLALLISAFALVMSAVIPLSIARIEDLASQRETRQQFVAKALQVLESDKLSKDSELRTWARKLIDTYSGVELSAEGAMDFRLLSQDVLTPNVAPGERVIPVAVGTTVEIPDLEIESLQASFRQSQGTYVVLLTVKRAGAEPVVQTIIPGTSTQAEADHPSSSVDAYEVAEIDPEKGIVWVSIRHRGTGDGDD